MTHHLNPRLVMEMGHIELLARSMRQNFVMLLQDLVEALQIVLPSQNVSIAQDNCY